MNQARNAAIVGLYEWPKRVDPDVSAMEIKALSIHRALEDAGLKWSDVDGLYDANDGEGGGGLGLAPYLGLHPRVIDTTSVGGTSYEFQV
ncbi:MAG: thiolase domain-containing protein, partial [Chloroflexota bacterium]